MESSMSSWRQGKGLATWWFRTCERGDASRLPPCPRGSEQLSEWLVERIRRIVQALAPFAALERLLIDTRTGGEAAHDLRGSQATIMARFAKLMAQEDGAVAARCMCTLHCIDIDGQSFSIKRGADIVIEAAFDARGEVDETQEIDLRLTLHVDIYSPRTPCEQPDNTRLAALNGPLLSGFIARMEATVPCRFDLASGDEYVDLLSHSGFVLPSRPPMGSDGGN